MKRIILPLFIVVILISALMFFRFFPVGKDGNSPDFTSSTSDDQTESAETIIAANLEIPWALDFLPASPAGGPDGNILFTERPGRVKLVDKDGGADPVLIAQISQVQPVGEGGLLGLAIHPDFPVNGFVYLYYTYAENGGNTKNRLSRYKFENHKLIDEKIIIDAIPGAANHNGGRIKFGPDGYLYITTGDAQNPSQAQDINSLAGKILRLAEDGYSIYSFGHRNPQGLAWDDRGRLWATEHGSSGMDEINLIEPGKNYGWPAIRGDDTNPGMESPQLHSGSGTWAPAGAAFVNNSIFFAGLRGQALYQATVAAAKISLTEHLKGKFGRLRDVVLGPDGLLYLTTGNRDGRGDPQADDDKIIRLDPRRL